MTGQSSTFSAFMQGLFITPAFLWFLAAIPVIIILYLLKLRRTEVVISSTLLWLRSLQDLTANAPFQRLRKNLLLLLQILIALALGLALARPYMRAEMLPGQYICLLIDRSASMQTLEKEGTRLDLAKQSALRLVNEMRWGDRMMVGTFGETADVLVELLAKGLASTVAPGGALILSGIKAEREAAIAEALGVAGFGVAERRETDGWVALLARSTPLP